MAEKANRIALNMCTLMEINVPPTSYIPNMVISLLDEKAYS